jgi:hypothetical protein
VVSALITAVVAIVGVSLARARSVSIRRQFLSSVLVESPMPVAAAADPLLVACSGACLRLQRRRSSS